MVNNVTKVVYSSGVQVAFLSLKIELGSSEDIEYDTQVVFIIFNEVRKDEYIVQIHIDEAANMVSELIDHDVLRGEQCIAITLLHNEADHCVIDGYKCHLANVFRHDVYLLIHIR